MDQISFRISLQKGLNFVINFVSLKKNSHISHSLGRISQNFLSPPEGDWIYLIGVCRVPRAGLEAWLGVRKILHISQNFVKICGIYLYWLPILLIQLNVCIIRFISNYFAVNFESPKENFARCSHNSREFFSGAKNISLKALYFAIFRKIFFSPKYPQISRKISRNTGQGQVALLS